MYGDKDNGLTSGVERISISDYLRAFLQELYTMESRRTELRTLGEASRIKGLMNIPENTLFKSLNDIRSGQPYWNEQEVDFVPSNLGKNRGFIFYFICNSCQRRVRHLYFLSSIDEPLCRVCSRLHYKQANRKTRALSRLINKEYLSTEAKYTLMKRAEINKGDIENYLSDFDPHK
jgi:hypothetical protein